MLFIGDMEKKWKYIIKEKIKKETEEIKMLTKKGIFESYKRKQKEDWTSLSILNSKRKNIHVNYL